MTGLIVLGLFLLYVAVAMGLTVRARGRWKLLVMAVFILIPTWDIIPGKIALAHYCEREGGIKVYRSVEGVEGFLIRGGTAYEEYFSRFGYKYIEIVKEKRDPRNGQYNGTEYVRVTLREDGKLSEEKVERPASRYELKSYQNFDTYISPWGITLFSASIVDSKTGEIIAVDKRFGWHGGWLRQVNRPILGSGGECERVDDSYASIFLRTLAPTKEIKRKK